MTRKAARKSSASASSAGRRRAGRRGATAISRLARRRHRDPGRGGHDAAARPAVQRRRGHGARAGGRHRPARAAAGAARVQPVGARRRAPEPENRSRSRAAARGRRAAGRAGRGARSRPAPTAPSPRCSPLATGLPAGCRAGLRTGGGAGLSCLLQRGTWGEFAALDRPGDPGADGSRRPRAPGRAEPPRNDARLLAGDTASTVPLGELLDAVVRRIPAAVAAGGRRRPPAVAQRVGSDVLWLRRALGELRGTPVLPADSRGLRRRGWNPRSGVPALDKAHRGGRHRRGDDADLGQQRAPIFPAGRGCGRMTEVSLILDALRKSEHQRQRQAGPGLAVVPEGRAATARRLGAGGRRPAGR
jgi:hypothetical protein